MHLLNPGPVTLSERVRHSLQQVDLCHRESEFFDLQDEVRTRLLATYSLDPAVWSAVLITGSGTAAVESMVAALVPAQGRVLVLENGVYGARITQICAQYGIAHERLVADWMRAIDLEALAARLATARGDEVRFTHIAVVHHETTTGRLNALAPLLELCRTFGLGLLVDGVSSFGAEAIDFGDAQLVSVAASANKCLHGVPGVAAVIVRRAALAAAATRVYYLDLSRLARLQDARDTPFTPAVHALYGLREALREFSDLGGREARHRHYTTLAETVRSGLGALGIPMLIPVADSSVVLRAYRLPATVTYRALHDALKERGFVIYAGQGNLSQSAFRISTMGDLDAGDIERLLQCFKELSPRPSR